MPKRLGRAVLIGCGITALSFVLFFAFPHSDNYLAAPGVVVAWLVNGGVHGNILGKWFAVSFLIIAAAVNVTLYSACWLLIEGTIRLAKKRVKSRKLEAGG